MNNILVKTKQRGWCVYQCAYRLTVSVRKVSQEIGSYDSWVRRAVLWTGG